MDLQIELGGVTEAVTVTADAPLIRSETSALGQVVDNRKIVDLPLNGRSFISLAGLAPSVALLPPPAAPLPRINGGRPRTNEYLFDGISVLQPEPGQVAFFPNIDAIQEFKIESNSPPAEFGRFNGGVVNLTTKSGSNAVHGSAFEFLRHEALNARNFFASGVPDKPEFRRNQFGGVIGGPIQQDRTFFFVDYQGQRQTIGRTVISTVPTLLQRQGIFTEPTGGRVIPIYDPATTAPGASGGTTRSPFPGNTIPQERIDPVARTLLARYPLPTSSGMANNYRRVDNETVDQDQFSVRLDHRFASNRDQVFGRLTRFREEFLPVTPLPDGSGTPAGALGPQNTTSWSFASNYQRTISPTRLNELRIGDTRRTVARKATELDGPASASLGLPGIPTTAQFPNTLPTFAIAGYTSLGSPQSTASDFSTSVTEIADSFSWFKGRHSFKMGADLRWERLNVVQPASPTGLFTFNNFFTDLPLTANTGMPFASFLLGQVQQFQIDLQQQQIRNRAHFQEYFIQDDWRPSDRLTINAGVRYTLNFPSTEENNQVAVLNLQTRQLDYLGQNGQPRAARELHKNNFGPRFGAVGRLNDKTRRANWLWIDLDRAGRDHDAVHDAGLSVRADRQPAHARQHRPGVHVRQRPHRRADSVDPDGRSRTGRIYSRERSRFRLRAAVECVASTRARVQPRRGGGLHRVEDYPRRPPRLESESADGRAACTGLVADAARAQSVLRHHPALFNARRPHDHPRAAAQAVSGVHDGQLLPAERRHYHVPGLLREARTAILARPVVSRQLHPFEADGRCLPGV